MCKKFFPSYLVFLFVILSFGCVCFGGEGSFHKTSCPNKFSSSNFNDLRYINDVLLKRIIFSDQSPVETSSLLNKSPYIAIKSFPFSKILSIKVTSLMKSPLILKRIYFHDNGGIAVFELNFLGHSINEINKCFEFEPSPILSYNEEIIFDIRPMYNRYYSRRGDAVQITLDKAVFEDTISNKEYIIPICITSKEHFFQHNKVKLLKIEGEQWINFKMGAVDIGELEFKEFLVAVRTNNENLRFQNIFMEGAVCANLEPFECNDSRRIWNHAPPFSGKSTVFSIIPDYPILINHPYTYLKGNLGGEIINANEIEPGDWLEICLQVVWLEYGTVQVSHTILNKVEILP